MKLHDSRQLGPLVFRDPLLLCSALYFLLYFDASGFLRLGGVAGGVPARVRAHSGVLCVSAPLSGH